MIAFVACWIFAPLFAWYVRQKGDAWMVNAFVSFLAFPVWSYAIGNVAFHRPADVIVTALVDSVMGPGEVVSSPEVDDRGVTHSTSDGVAATSQSKRHILHIILSM